MAHPTAALWRRKPIEPTTGHDARHGLQRVIGPFSLIALGVGTTVGAGLFSLTGIAAAHNAGPAVVIAFIIAAIACGFAGFCYAELASMIPTAGSAYSYAYATLGELVAWIIGWDLVLEYTVGAAAVASSWSSYLASMLAQWDIHPDPRWMASPLTEVVLADGTTAHGWINLPAMGAIVFIVMLLLRGISESTRINAVVVVLKLAVVLAFVVFCAPFIKSVHYHPFLPPNTGEFGHFGISGIMRAAGMIFFAYLGFDIIATTAQEARRPERTMPIGILGSLAICTVIYIVFALVLTGVVDYRQMENDGSPVATAVDVTHMSWLQSAIKFSILFGYISVLMGLMIGQVRVFYAMSHDGLLPQIFGRLSPRTRAPATSHLVFLVITCLLTGLVPISALGNMTSIGTLLAFVIVCIGVLLLRLREPERVRAFRAPGGLLMPICGILSCGAVMLSLDGLTWLRLLLWLAFGLIIYMVYGRRNSVLNSKETRA
ncbi:APC family permease [Swaminathania salitolerans]|uniref:Amino acid transporter n=1 Tax=Swaminathania salitolerans TaxID=182838 RepID=A0A511BN73_9PROT|nr:amino acid permease [Swaminathania salitolerans]GBQ13884.1 amino acid transporter [Swaminathania salitolerans LMG 21291]GEL01705.1 amino acid transporter [Swaminathania salitolerans]